MVINIAALILAGGASSRMGQDKALLLWDGVPLLQRVIRVVAQCCGEVYLLTPWRDRYQSHFPAYAPPKYHWLEERVPTQGPVVALGQGLAVIPADWVLVLACDLPLLDIRILQKWRSQLPHLPSSTLAFVPYQDYWHPLCGFYRPQVLVKLEAFLAQGGKSFQPWLSHLPAQKIFLEAPELRMLWNCNSPQDLQHFAFQFGTSPK